jgi:large subunit ribosomal protein L41e
MPTQSGAYNPVITMKRSSRAWKKRGKQRWKWRKKKMRRRKRAQKMRKA